MYFIRLAIFCDPVINIDKKQQLQGSVADSITLTHRVVVVEEDSRHGHPGCFRLSRLVLCSQV